MRKNYILDTSTIVYDFNCFRVFKGNDVIIPLKVLEELDHVKNRTDFGGANARRAIRAIDEFFKDANPSNGVDIGNDITLFIDNSSKRDERFDRAENDDLILSCASRYENSILVSKDIAMRLRASCFGLKAQDYTNDKLILEANDIYTGNEDIILEEFYEGFDDSGLDSCTDTVFERLYPNECAQVTANGKNRIYRKKADGSLRPIIQRKKEFFGIRSRNKEQAYALELLLDKDVPLVSLVGKAGTGKSLLSVCAALECVLEEGMYDRVEIYRPIVSVGKDVGFLPGSLAEKLDPWFGAIKNALEFVIPKNVSLDEFMFMNKNKIRFEAISYIRGKSLNNTMIIVDECFPYDQYIETSVGKKKIGTLYKRWENKKNLPMIKSYNEKTGDFEYKKIVNAWCRGEKNLVKITCGNIEIKCTPNHKFLTSKGWVEADSLVIGDFIKANEPDSFGIFSKKEILSEKEVVYDIEVEDNHNFIVCSADDERGLIAHNCQNLSRGEIKTIITRAGFNSKIILTGDIEQVDGLYLDASSNGLSYVVEKFKTSNLAGHMLLTKGERSELATEASMIL